MYKLCDHVVDARPAISAASGRLNRTVEQLKTGVISSATCHRGGEDVGTCSYRGRTRWEGVDNDMIMRGEFKSPRWVLAYYLPATTLGA
jgi:hypothetical protein